MEVGQPHTRKREFVEMWGRDFAAEGSYVRISEIVGNDVENVWVLPFRPDPVLSAGAFAPTDGSPVGTSVSGEHACNPANSPKTIRLFQCFMALPRLPQRRV